MPRRYTQFEKQEIVRIYEEGQSIDALALSVDVSYSSMKQNLRRWGAGIRRRGPRRRIKVDERYFREIDTHEKAYWLGVLCARSCVYRGGSGNSIIRLDLSERAHLEAFLSAIGSDAKIVNGGPGLVNSASISCTQMVQDLRRHGVVERRARDGRLPAVPAIYRPTVFRGYYDGCGTIWSAPDGQTVLSVYGNDHVLETFIRWICTDLWIQESQVETNDRGTYLMSLSLPGNIVIEQVLEWAYSTPGPRSQKRYDQYLMDTRTK